MQSGAFKVCTVQYRESILRERKKMKLACKKYGHGERESWFCSGTES